jgi:hypothetical protein
MIEPADKTRKRVVAEITISHLTRFAAEIGRELGQNEAIGLLNRGELAYEMWVHMMQAAEQCIKAALVRQHSSGAVEVTRATVERPHVC